VGLRSSNVRSSTDGRLQRKGNTPSLSPEKVALADRESINDSKFNTGMFERAGVLTPS